MRFVINIEKRHFYGFLVIIVILGGAIAMGQISLTPNEFGHAYGELNLANSIKSSDIKDGSLTANDIQKDASGLVQLFVGRSFTADRLNNKREDQLNFDYGKCVFVVQTCDSGGATTSCPGGYKDQFDSMNTGGFQFSGQGRSYDGSICNRNGNRFMTICCRN